MSHESPDAAVVDIGGRKLSCTICANSEFWHRRVQLHGAVATFFKLEFLGPNADCYVCSKCGYVHWFLPIADR